MQQSSYSGTTQVRDSEDERNPHQTWLAPEDRIINMNRSWTVEHLAAGPDTEGTAHTAGVPQSLSLPEATSSATAAPSEPSSPAAGPSRPPTVAGPSSPSPTTLSRGRRATFFIPDSDDEEYDSDAIAAEQEEADRQHQAMINAPAYPVRVNERLRRRLTDESEARGAASDSGGGGLRSCC